MLGQVFPADIAYGNHFTSTHPSSFFTFARVERAKVLLLRGQMPAIQVALKAGFAHQSHMARWIRRALGVTPTSVVRSSRTVSVGIVVPFGLKSLSTDEVTISRKILVRDSSPLLTDQESDDFNDFFRLLQTMQV
jgi:AraC-like DNA-binding protein